VITTPLCVKSEKPEYVTVIEYVPTGSWANLNPPAPSVVRLRLWLVSVFTTIAVAPTTTPPLESTTVPSSVLVGAWADVAPALHKTSANVTSVAFSMVLHARVVPNGTRFPGTS